MEPQILKSHDLELLPDHRQWQDGAVAGKTGAFEEIRVAAKGLYMPHRAVVLAMITVLGFCLIINSSWTPTPDAALYLALGESLAHGEGYVFNGEPHTFVPPGYPLIVAGAARVFGSGFTVYRVLMALLGLLTALTGLLLVVRIGGRDVGFLVGGLFALSHLLLENSALTLADVPFAFFAFASLHAVLSAGARTDDYGSVVISGLLVGALPLIRINGLGVLPAAAFYLYCSWTDLGHLRRLLRLLFFLVLSLAPTVAWQLWKASFPVSVEEGTYLNMIMGRELGYQLSLMFTTLWGYMAETSYALTGVGLRTGVLEVVAPLLAFVGMVIAWRKGDRLLAPLTVVQYLGLLLSPAGSRYLIFLVPGLYLFLGLGILWVTGRVLRTGSGFLTRRRVLIGCFALLALLNVGHNIKTVWQSRTSLEANGAESPRGLPFFAAARWLKANAPDAVVLTAHSRVIHYLSGCRTVSLVRSGIPDHEAFVRDEQLIKRLVRENNAQFFFADSKDARMYWNAVEAIQSLGLELREIPEASSLPRYHLFAIVKAGSRTDGRTH